MRTKGKKKKIVWSRRYLTLDRYMSGKFKPQFLWSAGISTAVFILLWLCFGLTNDISFGKAFIQLSNPSDTTSGWQWLPVVILNLFGLFVLNGVILTLLVNWVSSRKDSHEKGEARYDYVFTRPYSVIIGGHKIVASLARDLMREEQPNEYILIQTLRNPEKLRREIAAEITDEAIARRVIIYSGDRTARHELEELHLDNAREIYLIGEPDFIDGTSHDAINMQTWQLMNSIYSAKRTKRIPCHVMFEYQSTFSAFQFTDLKLEHSPTFRFIPFSTYENWAQQVLISPRKDDGYYYMPLDGAAGLQYSSPERVHLVIAGMSKMGMSLAIEAAHVAHYPNFNNDAVGNPRTLITMIDRDAKREMLFFMGRFRELFRLVRWRYVKAPDGVVDRNDEGWNIYDSTEAMTSGATNEKYRWNDPLNDSGYGSAYYGGHLGQNLIDIDFEFIEGDVAFPSIQKYIADAASDTLSRTTVAICFPVAAEAMSAALYFQRSVYRNVQQIWVQQPESGALVDAVRHGLTGQDNAVFSVLRPFGMLGQCDYLTRIHSFLPKLVHYAYECMNVNSSLEKKFADLPLDKFTDEVLDAWENMQPDKGKSVIAKRWSNIYCANSFETKKRSGGDALNNPGSPDYDTTLRHFAYVEHNRWVIEQLLLGFRPVSNDMPYKLPMDDADLKKSLKAKNIHPDIVSNEILGKISSYDVALVRIIPLTEQIIEKLHPEQS